MRIPRAGGTLLNQQRPPGASRWDSHVQAVRTSNQSFQVTRYHLPQTIQHFYISAGKTWRQDPLERKTGVLHDSTCDSCEEHFMDETARTTKDWKDTENRTSAVCEHQTEAGHGIAWEDVRDHQPRVSEQPEKDEGEHLTPKTIFKKRQYDQLWPKFTLWQLSHLHDSSNNNIIQVSGAWLKGIIWLLIICLLAFY